MKKILPTMVLALLLEACNVGNISLAVSTPRVSPSPQPSILSPNPPFVPSATSTITIVPVSPTLSATSSFPPTEIFSSTSTPTPLAISTSTPTAMPIRSTDLDLGILGCNTSLDILHQMGEVTNAYPVVRNSTGQNLTNVCATLSASDEARVHPDKTACVVGLPNGYQVILKLTVDTGVGQDTAIQVVVNTNEGPSASSSRPSCRDIGLPGWLPDKVGMIEPIPI